MKRTITRKIGILFVPLLMLLSAMVVGGSPATANENPEDTVACAPQDAYDETVVDEEAYDETVVDEEAYDETVVDEEAYDETVVIKEAYDETVVIKEAYDETVVDKEAYVQRYSWNGNNPNDGNPPAFPGEKWQANVKGDPHKIGHEGAYFISHGNQGNGDWFYLDFVDETSHVVHHEAVTHIVSHEAVTNVVHHEAVTHVVTHEAVTHIVSHEAVAHIVNHPAVPCTVPFPTPEVTDPCGTGNASWVKPVDTEEVHWSIGDAGQLTGETQIGYVWPNNTTVNGWGQATETNTEACPVIPEEPPVVTPPVVTVPVVTVPVVTVPVVDKNKQTPVAKTTAALPDTGAPEMTFLLVGLVLMLSGAAVLKTRKS